MNGAIPMLAGPPLAQGFVTYGSDSGHQASFGRGPARGDAAASDDWALNEEAIRNLGYMQLKKTHDAAMVLIERLYGSKPRFNYFVGSSQGGREALTVAQRYPNDYNGVAANVPIVGFSSLMLAPALIRIHEKPQANWVTAPKINAIRGEFMRQCDKLDGLVDGIINNYMACRETFDVKQGKPNRHPWAAKRCPNNIDPNPADTSADACLTDGQISTLEFVYSRYAFSQALANGVKTFGMWLPNTDPSGSGLIANTRFRGQEGAAENAAPYKWIGVLGVTGFLLQDLQGNALDYVEGGKYIGRREALSEILDSSNPDFSAFVRRGGKNDRRHRQQRYSRVAGYAARFLSIGCWSKWDAPKSTVLRASMFFPRPAMVLPVQTTRLMAMERSSKQSPSPTRSTALHCSPIGWRKAPRQANRSRSPRASAACPCAPIPSIRNTSKDHRRPPNPGNAALADSPLLFAGETRRVIPRTCSVVQIGMFRPRAQWLRETLGNCAPVAVRLSGAFPFSTHCTIASSASKLSSAGPPAQWFMPGTGKKRAKLIAFSSPPLSFASRS